MNPGQHDPAGRHRTDTAGSRWREAVLALAGKHYRQGHDAENRGAQLNDTEPAGAADEQWARAAVHEQVYGELAALLARLDPRPGAPETTKPW